VKKTFALIVAVMMLIAVLAGCSSSKNSVEITVYNWGEYIDEEINDIFTEETGIKVNYKTYESNEEMYAKLKSGGSSFDVIIPSDYMIGRLIEEDMLEALDFTNIPNFEYIDERFRNMEYDPSNAYSVPYTWGTVGIVYNTTMVDKPVTSWDILWDEDYKDQILMFNNSRDAMGIALKRLGYSYNCVDEGQLREAAELLREQKNLVQAYVMDQIFTKMPGGEAAIAPYYAGDFLTMYDENEDLAFCIPEEGTNVFVDAMCIPKGCKHKSEAEQYINFITRPDIMARNIDFICYSSPSSAARELTDEELAQSEYCYPPDEILDRCEVYTNLPQEVLELYDKLWIEILK